MLREADPDEIARVNDRFDGYVGKRLQVKRAEDSAAAQARALAEAKQKARESRDPDQAMAVIDQETEAQLAEASNAARERGLKVHSDLLSDPLTKDFAEPFNGRDYAAMAQGNLIAAEILHMADLGRSFAEKLPEWKKAIRAEVEKELTPVLTKRIRAQLRGEEPEEDRGSSGGGGGAEWRTMAELRAAIKAMPLAEYARRIDEIDAASVRLQRGRVA